MNSWIMIAILSTVFLSRPIFANPVLSCEQASCQQALDCKGLLPHYCVICQDGTEGGCAHWSCEENQCIIRTCDTPTER